MSVVQAIAKRVRVREPCDAANMTVCVVCQQQPDPPAGLLLLAPTLTEGAEFR